MRGNNSDRDKHASEYRKNAVTFVLALGCRQQMRCPNVDQSAHDDYGALVCFDFCVVFDWYSSFRTSVSLGWIDFINARQCAADKAGSNSFGPGHRVIQTFTCDRSIDSHLADDLRLRRIR